MTKRERFESVMAQRGYEVSRLGLVTILRHGDYTAYHFFTAEGDYSSTEDPYWVIG